jgi:hypothetical protein
MRLVFASLLIAAMVWSLPARQSIDETSATTPRPFDRYNNLCWDHEKARLDNFAIHLKSNPDIVGEVIVYAGRQSCPNEAKYRSERARKWILNLGIESDRLTVRDGGFRQEVENVMWTRSKDLGLFPLEPTLKKEEVSIRRRCVDKVFEKVICLNR